MAKGEVKPEKSWAESLGAGQLEGDHWYHVVFKGLFPLGVYLLSYLLVRIFYGVDMVTRWVELTFMFIVPPFGTATIVPWGIKDGFGGLTMVLTVTMVDFIISMWIVWWFVLLKKIPYLGKIFVWTEKKAGEKIEANPKWKRGTWWVIYCTLLVPFQGSGGMNMSIIGKLIGLRADTVVSAVVAGSFSIALFTAFMTTVGIKLYAQDPALLIILAFVTIQALCFVIFINRRFKVRQWEKELGLAPGEYPEVPEEPE